MKNVNEELSNFVNMLRASQYTKRRHHRYLSYFISYLEQQTGQEIEQIFLDQFYVQTDKTGRPLRYLPIDGEFLDEYMNSHSDKSYNWLLHTKNALSRFFGHLFKVYELPNPVKSMEFNIKHFKPTSRPRKPFSRHDILRFLHSLVSNSTCLKRDLILFSLLVSTGCRPNEVLSLKVEQLQFDDDMILLPKTKTRKQRLVPLRKGMGKLLRTYCEQEDFQKTDYIFPDGKGEYLTLPYVNGLLKQYLPFSDTRTLYSFRHTFATIMYESGTDLAILQQLLGHDKINSTKNYVQSHYVRNYNIKISENQKLYEKIKERVAKELLE